MVVWLITLALLALRLPVHSGSVGQSPRRTLLDDAEDVHDLYKEEGMKEITNSLVSQMSSACDVTHVIVRLILKEAEERSKLALRLQARLRKMNTKLAAINAEPPPPGMQEFIISCYVDKIGILLDFILCKILLFCIK